MEVGAHEQRVGVVERAHVRVADVVHLDRGAPRLKRADQWTEVDARTAEPQHVESGADVVVEGAAIRQPHVGNSSAGHRGGLVVVEGGLRSGIGIVDDGRTPVAIAELHAPQFMRLALLDVDESHQLVAAQAVAVRRRHNAWPLAANPDAVRLRTPTGRRSAS